MPYPHRLVPLAVTLLVLSNAPRADEVLLLSEADFLVDIPEVTSVTRIPQRVSDAPASTTIIDREIIAASGFQTIPDLLRLVPGFQSYMQGANRFGVAYHGSFGEYPNQLEVMVDGRSVYIPLLATVTWDTLGISLEDVEQIEVVRGSNVPSQGSNAFLGSINIITREPTASSGLDLSLLYGSQDTRNAHLSYADSNGLFSYRLSASHEQNDGNSHYSNFYTSDWYADDGSDGHWQDDLARDYLNISTTWTPNLVDSFWFRFGVDRGNKTTGSLNTDDHYFDNREHDSLFVSGKYSHLYSDTGTLQLSAYHNRLKLDTPLASVAAVLTEFDSAADPDCTNKDNLGGLDALLCPGGDGLLALRPAIAQAVIDFNDYHLVSEDGETSTTDLEVQLNDRFGALSLASGLGYRHLYAGDSSLLQSGEVQEDRSRLFATLQYELSPRWQASSGLMHEYSSEDSDTFSYRNALIFKPRPDTSIRLGYSRAERLPSLLERYSNYSLYMPAFEPLTDKTALLDTTVEGNPDLNEEQIRSWELGFYRALAARNSYLDIRLFRERITDGITTYWIYDDDEPDKRIRTLRNSGAWTNQGVETQLRYQFTPGFWGLLTYSYINSYAEVWRKGDPGTKSKEWNRDDEMAPEHSASLLLSWSPIPSLDLSLTQYYVDEVEWAQADFVDEYHRTDLRAAKHWPLDNRTELETALIIQNAFGPAYKEFYEYNMFDRRIYLQLRLRHD